MLLQPEGFVVRRHGAAQIERARAHLLDQGTLESSQLRLEDLRLERGDRV